MTNNNGYLPGRGEIDMSSDEAMSESIKRIAHGLTNPLYPTVENASTLASRVFETCEHYELSIEQRKVALEVKQAAQQAYDEAELDFLTMFRFEADYKNDYKATNADQRKDVDERQLIEARDGGPLARAWSILNTAINDFDNADMAYSQMEAQWKAVRIVANLQAAMLGGASNVLA